MSLSLRPGWYSHSVENWISQGRGESLRIESRALSGSREDRISVGADQASDDANVVDWPRSWTRAGSLAIGQTVKLVSPHQQNNTSAWLVLTAESSRVSRLLFHFLFFDLLGGWAGLAPSGLCAAASAATGFREQDGHYQA